MPVPLPPEQRSTFTDADLYPSSSLHRMRTHITVSLQNGDFAGALKIYQRLRGRYTGGRQAQDGKLAKSIEARDNARWLESIFARVEEAPEETLKTASDWLRCSDGAALSGHVHAVTLSGLLSVAECVRDHLFAALV